VKDDGSFEQLVVMYGLNKVRKFKTHVVSPTRPHQTHCGHLLPMLIADDDELPTCKLCARVTEPATLARAQEFLER
jgi:hypothetical protein